MRKIGTFAAAVCAALLIAVPAEAQVRQVTVGVSGGPSFPIGSDMSDHFGTGWHVQGSFALAPVTLPFGIRADLLYQRLPDDLHDDEQLTTLAGIVNAMFSLGGFGLRPYATVGVGVYNNAEGDFDSTDFGINGGLGAQFGLGGLNAFLEGKFHNVFTEGESIRFIPISIGIMF